MFTNYRCTLMFAALLIVGAVTNLNLFAQQACIGTTNYTTLQEAVQAAQPNETVKLLENVSNLPATIVVTQPICIDLNGYSVTQEDNLRYIFEIKKNATIKNGNIIHKRTSISGLSTACVYSDSKNADVISFLSVIFDGSYYGVMALQGKNLAFANCSFINGTYALRTNCSVTATSTYFYNGITFSGAKFKADNTEMVDLTLDDAISSALTLNNSSMTVTSPLILNNSSSLTMFDTNIHNETGDGLKLSDNASVVMKNSSVYSDGLSISLQGNSTLSTTKCYIDSKNGNGVELSGHAKAYFSEGTISTWENNKTVVIAAGNSHVEFYRGQYINRKIGGSYTGYAFVTEDNATFKTTYPEFVIFSKGSAVLLTAPVTEINGIEASASLGTALTVTGNVNKLITNCQLDGSTALKASTGGITLGAGNSMSASIAVINATSSLYVVDGEYHGGYIFATEGHGDIQVSGGHFICSADRIFDSTNEGTVKLSGGIYTVSPDQSLLADGCTVAEISAGQPVYDAGYRYYVKTQYNWQNVKRGLCFATLEKAVADANQGETLKMLCDVFRSSAPDFDNIYIKKTVNLDLNNHTLNLGNTSIFIEAPGCNISNGSIIADNGDQRLLYIMEGGCTLSNLTLENTDEALFVQYDNSENITTLSNCNITGSVAVDAQCCMIKATDCAFTGSERSVDLMLNKYEGQNCLYYVNNKTAAEDANSSVFKVYVDQFEDIDGQVYAKSSLAYGLNIVHAEHVKLDGMTVIGNFTSAATLYDDSGDMTITDCSMSNTSESGFALSTTSSSATVQIVGGTYQSNASIINQESQLEIIDGQFDCTDGVLISTISNRKTTIHNGMFNTKNMLLTGSLGANIDLVIKGGYFVPNPKKWLADGLSTETPTGAYCNYNYHVTNQDVNGDGKFSIGDLAAAIAAGIHRGPFPGGRLPRNVRRTAADMNGDGEVDDDDIDLMRRMLLNIKTSADSIQFANNYEYVDLGIRDAEGNIVYWAKSNLGTTNPSEVGLYFAWGETNGYSTDDARGFDWNNYKWTTPDPTVMTHKVSDESYINKYTVDDFRYECSWYNDNNEFCGDGKEQLDREDDAARVAMGGTWRIPTTYEVGQLFEKCDITYSSAEDNNGHAGFKIANKQDSKQFIFVPVSGIAEQFGNVDKLIDSFAAYFWTSNICQYEDGVPDTTCGQCARLSAEDGELPSGLDACYRCLGMPIRPVFVCKAELVEADEQGE